MLIIEEAIHVGVPIVDTTQSLRKILWHIVPSMNFSVTSVAKNSTTR